MELKIGKIYVGDPCYVLDKPIYNDIVNTDKTWEELKEKYQPIYNELHSECKKLFDIH